MNHNLENIKTIQSFLAIIDKRQMETMKAIDTLTSMLNKMEEEAEADLMTPEGQKQALKELEPIIRGQDTAIFDAVSTMFSQFYPHSK